MLNGRAVLIVEAEFLIALDIQRMLETLDAGQTLFARNADEARQLGAHWPDIALAVVALQFGDPASRVLSDDLKNTGIALVLTTGDVNLPKKMTGDTSPIIVMPISEDALTSAVRQALAPRS